MEEEGVSYETLQELLRVERRSNKLAPVPEGFWGGLQEFLRDNEAEFREAQARDPFDRRSMMLRDRVMNARHAADSFWTLRERKIAMLALANAREGHPAEGLTKKERDLYDRLIATLRDGRRSVFEGTSAEAEYVGPLPHKVPRASTPPAPPADVPRPREEAAPDTKQPAPRPEPVPERPRPDDEGPAPHAPDAPGAPGAPGAPLEKPVTVVPPDQPDATTVTIRALGDIPPFVGPDMETYILEEGDLATVPEGIANLLVKRGKAAVVATANP